MMTQISSTTLNNDYTINTALGGWTGGDGLSAALGSLRKPWKNVDCDDAALQKGLPSHQALRQYSKAGQCTTEGKQPRSTRRSAWGIPNEFETQGGTDLGLRRWAFGRG